MSDDDVQNALAIASLLENTSKKNPHVLNGMDIQTSTYLEEMSCQVERLYKGKKRDQPPTSVAYDDSQLDLDWYKKPLTSDTKWAKNTLSELMKRKPPVTSVKNDLGTDHNKISDDSLRQGLSPDQLRVLDHAITCFDTDKPLRVFVHGGPGTGKSFLANLLMKAASIRGLVSRFTALSGAAATINGGTTIHYAMGWRGKHISWKSGADTNGVKKIRDRNSGIRLLIVDEISMAHAEMWNKIKTDLQHAKLWEPLHVVAMGDMCQLPPPTRFVKSLYVDFVLSARKPTTYAAKPWLLNGVNNFKKLKKMELTTQNRAKNDVKHTQAIQQLRMGVIDDDFLDSLTPLKAADIDLGWKFVPILVTSNAEVIMINRRQVREFAKSHNQYVLKWTNPIRNCENAGSYDINVVESLVPEAVQYFCVGAPGYCNANKNPVATGIVNGYRVVQHSLIWQDNPWTPPDEAWTPGGTRTGSLISVVIVLTTSVTYSLF